MASSLLSEKRAFVTLLVTIHGFGIDLTKFFQQFYYKKSSPMHLGLFNSNVFNEELLLHNNEVSI